MSAKVAPRINLQERTPLQEVIPLSTPFVLFVDPSSACNFRCRFCPTSSPELYSKTRRPTIMRFSLFEKIVETLKDFPTPLKVLRLYKDGEPFLNPRLPEMIALARSAGIAHSIDTTTNGSLLTPDRALAAIEAGLDRINISLDGLSDDDFLRFTGTAVSFDQLVRNITEIYKYRGTCTIFIKAVDELLDEDKKERFMDTFSPIVDMLHIEHIAPCWPEFDVENRLDVKITEGIYGQQIQSVDTCPYVFYTMSVNAEGSVSVCFLDWSHGNLIGDVRNENLQQIWQGELMQSYRLKMLLGERTSIPFCRECKQLSHCLPDNIDPYREEILARIC